MSLLKQPSALIPLVMSAAAFAMASVAVALVGLPEGPVTHDEGAAARIFQFLIVGQAPVVVYFAIKWLPLAPAPALRVLALQIGAAILALSPPLLLGF